MQKSLPINTILRSAEAAQTERSIRVFCLAALLICFILYYNTLLYKIYIIGLAIIVFANILLLAKSAKGVRLLYPLIIFEIYQAISSFWSPDYLAGIGQSALDVVFFGFALIPFMYSDVERKWLSLSLIKWYAIAMVICVFTNMFYIGELIDAEKGAFRSSFAVAFLVSLAPLVGEALLKKSLFSSVALLIILAVGFQLQSRVFLLFSVPVMLAAVGICLVKDVKKLRAIYILSAVLAVLATLAIYQVGGSAGFIENSRLGSGATELTLGDTVFSEANSPGAQSVDIERRLVTQVSIDSFYQAPIFGAGYMSTAYYVGLLTRYDTAAHGLPSSLLGETGAIGAILFVVICVLSVRGYLLRSRQCEAAERQWIYLELLTFIAALIAGLFHQANHDFFLYLMMGGGLAGRRLLRAPSGLNWVAA